MSSIKPLQSILSSLESGARPKGGVTRDSGEIPSLGGEHVDDDGGFKLSSVKRIPRQFFEAMRAGRIEPFDILVVKDGATTGKTSLVREDFPFRDAAVNEHVFCLRVDSGKASPTYVYHFLRSPRGQKAIQLDFRGATVGGISREFASKVVLPVPSLPEQRRIAEILDLAEALRAKRRAALAQVDSLSHAIFLDLFGEPATNPNAWQEGSCLGDVAEIVSGVTKGRPLNGRPARIVPYLAVSNVQDRWLDLSTTKTIDATEDEIQRYRLQRNDLLLTEGGDPDKLGRGTLWNNELPECIHQNHIFRVRLSSHVLHPLFLSWLMGSERGKRYFLRSAKQTTGIASINMTQLRGFPLLLPPLPLQHEFARRVAAVEKLKTAQRTSLAHLDALFASLQHRAFRGEL